MIKGGLVSVTFRQKSPRQVIQLVRQAGLEGIEWGGDIHVPHGDINLAREVKSMTLDAGLRLTSYGSYYRVGESENLGLSFHSVCDTAAALGVPYIRVWAGQTGSADADDETRKRVIEDSRRIADIAATAEMRISYEYHQDTLTDTNESAFRLLKEVQHPAVMTHWQPPNNQSVEYCLQGLRNILARCPILHVFSWKFENGDRERMPLSYGEEAWMHYLSVVHKAGGYYDALIEFVRDDSDKQFLEDAKTLTSWLNQLDE